MVIATLACVPPPPRRIAYDAPILDTLTFGDVPSESRHGFRGPQTISATGGLGQPCRRVAPDGSLAFELACDPKRQNYLTIKLWGSDTGQGQLLLFDGERQLSRYLSDTPELDVLSGEPAFPGRSLYVTARLPREMTQGRSTVALRIVSVGQPRPYSRDRKPGAQTSHSRGIYRAYSHIDPFFAPPADEAQGEPPRPARPAGRRSDPARLDALRKQADEALATLMAWQKFGPEWGKAVAAGQVPAVMTGAIPPRGAENRKWSKREWLDGFASRCMRDNLRTMNALALFARAYRSPSLKHYRRAELIDRIVAGIDFWCIAQGYNGGFTDIWKHQWVGGPERRRTGGCLDGFGIMGLAESFIVAYDAIEQSGALGRKLDNDDSSETPSLVRRVAYAQLFRKARDYLVSQVGRGHAPNQDLANVLAAWLANDCVDLLEPGRSWPYGLAIGYARSAAGLARDPYGGHWISAKGLAMEPNGSSNGGYCGNYGEGCVAMLCRLAQLTRDRAIRERAIDAIHAFAHFRYPSLDADGRPCLRKEEVISCRNNRSPGRIAYGLIPWAALDEADPVALRLAHLYFAHDRPWFTSLDPTNAHYISHVTAAMDLLDRFEALRALQPKLTRLPMEAHTGTDGWADGTAGVVALRHGSVRLYAALNWRHGFKPGAKGRSPANARANQIARIHCTTPFVDRIATIAMKSPHGVGKLSICRYGPYLIVMNGDPNVTLHDPLPALTGKAVDLLSGKRLNLADGLEVPPATTFVLYLPSIE